MSTAAAGLLRDPKTSAVALLEATHRLVGDYLAWEPESIWTELGHHHVEVPVENRAKLMAGLTLRLIPAFYWDAVVYEKTALALDGIQPHPDILEEAAPASLAWAVVEAAWILRRAKEHAWDFQHEPRAYTGVILARAGFVVTPAELSFAQLALDRERHDDALRDDVAERWAKTDKTNLAQLVLEESCVDVQIARLAAVEHHVRERQQAADRDLAVLG